MEILRYSQGQIIDLRITDYVTQPVLVMSTSSDAWIEQMGIALDFFPGAFHSVIALNPEKTLLGHELDGWIEPKLATVDKTVMLKGRRAREVICDAQEEGIFLPSGLWCSYIANDVAVWVKDRPRWKEDRDRKRADEYSDEYKIHDGDAATENIDNKKEKKKKHDPEERSKIKLIDIFARRETEILYKVAWYCYLVQSTEDGLISSREKIAVSEIKVHMPKLTKRQVEKQYSAKSNAGITVVEALEVACRGDMSSIVGKVRHCRKESFKPLSLHQLKSMVVHKMPPQPILMDLLQLPPPISKTAAQKSYSRQNHSKHRRS